MRKNYNNYINYSGLLQEELADKIVLSNSTLSKIEREKYNCGLSIAALLDIADGWEMEMSIYYIL